MKINHRHFILIFFATLTLVVSTGGYIFLYSIVMSQAKESSLARNEVIIGNKKKLQEKELTALYADTQDERSRISSFVVSEEKIVNFIETVEKIGTDSLTDLEMSSISTEKSNPKDKNKAGHITAHITARGSWPNVMRSLILVENLPYSVSVNNVNLSIAGAGESPTSSKLAKTSDWILSLDIKVLSK